MKIVITLSALLLLITLPLRSTAQSNIAEIEIIGPDVVVAPVTATYEVIFRDFSGNIINSPNYSSINWFVSVGIEATPGSDGYRCRFSWSKSGGYSFLYCEVYITGVGTFSDEYPVYVNSLTPPIPDATFSQQRSCLKTTVSASTPHEKANYQWYWQSEPYGTSTASSVQNNVVFETPAPLYLRARSTDAPYNWSAESQFAGQIEIINNAPPAPSTTNGYTIGEGWITLEASVVTGATTYRWYTQSVGGSPFSLQRIYSDYIRESTDFWVSAVANNCESSRTKVSAIVYPMPIVLVTNDGVIDDGKPVTFQVQNLIYDTYTWVSPAGTPVPGANSPGYTTNQAGLYKLTVTKGSSAATTPGILITEDASGTNQNYINENIALRPLITGTSDPTALSPSEMNRSFSYFDGLGRPIQKVAKAGSPSQHDIVQPFAYDEIGRELRSYLPYAAESQSGQYKKNALRDPNIPGDDVDEKYRYSAQYQFYNTTNISDVARDTNPYSEIIAEASPQGRPQRNYGAGHGWSAESVNKFIGSNYLTNTHGTLVNQERVIAWTLDGSGMPSRQSPKQDHIESGGYYSSQQLFIKQTTDESGHAVREYTDKLNRIVLKKIQATEVVSDLNNRDAWALTYYIYDDLNNLRYVLQPELSKIVHQNDSYVPTAADLKAFAFQYRYDYRNRMSEKMVPGQDWTYLVYDNRDLLILTQDGNQRSGTTKYWTFTKYDGLKRPVASGIKDTTIVLTQQAMQNAVNTFYAKAWTSVYETYIGNTAGNIHGYSNKSYPIATVGAATNPQNYLAITYYDTYDFKTQWPDDYKYLSDRLQQNANNVSYNQPQQELKLAIGLQTGSKVKVLDGGITGGYTWLKSVNYYDDKYHLIQAQADNYKGGIDKVSNLYDFVGNVLASRTTHAQADVMRWKDMVGTNTIGNKIIRTVVGSATWGNSGIASAEFLPANTDGWIEFTATEVNTSRVVGLSTTNADENYTTIGYAFYLRNDGLLFIVESGTTKGQIAGGYKAGDILRIQRTGTQIRYIKNGVDVSPSNPSQVASSTVLCVDMAFGTTSATIIDVRSSFTSEAHTIDKRFVYDHAGRLMREYHRLDSQPEVELLTNEYNELGQLIDKKLHSVSGAPHKQSIDYRYNIRGWLTNINDSELTDDDNDYFGMNLAYNGEQGTGNSEFTIGTENQTGNYTFSGNTNDNSPKVLNGAVQGATLTADNNGNVNQAYAFDGTGYIEIPNSKTEHAFIQNTKKFTIAAFVKLNDLSARSVILSSSGTSVYKGFLFMYETIGGTSGDHQLRLTLTNGQSGTGTTNLGAKNTINDTNWHHVAVVGDGTYIRFYVDGVLDGTPSPITIQSTGDANYTTLIGKTRTTNGAVTLGLNGALDELNIFSRPLKAKEIQALTRKAQAGVKQTAGGQYNGNISAMKWSVNQGLSDIKQMVYNFDYDPMNRLSQASHLQAGSSVVSWQNGNFNEGELQYDLNGNIRNLVRYGDSGMQDNLTYNYGTAGATSNQLLKVSDTADKFIGFIDGTNTTNDYSYDANGNMLLDLNKGISTAITYNYLNLPELVTRGIGTVRYIYDAIGRKLAQTVTSGTLNKRTDYAGEFFYEDDALQFINHEEGRITVANPELIYTFDGSTTDPINAVDATVETAKANGDQTYAIARATTTNNYSGMFPIGGTFPVQPGERYKIRARGYRDKGTVTTSNAAYIRVQANGANIAWPGAALQASAATEAWVEQIVTIPAGATTLEAGVVWSTVAVGNAIYLNDFEITKLNSTDPEYQYFIKDHLGNVRITFTTKDETDTSLATLEDQNETKEQGKFIYYDEAVKLYSNFFDHTNNLTTQPTGPIGDPDAPNADGPAGYAAMLRGGTNERYGLAKSLSVMPGDVIKMEVYAKYLDPNTQSWSTQLASLMASIANGTAPTGTVIDGGAAGTLGGATFPFTNFLTHTNDETNGPKAYLNWIVFDKNYTQKDAGYIKLSEAAAESGQNVPHERLAHNLTIKDPGYIYIYLSNENETPVDVFFDDFKIEQVKSPIIQTEDYYPFGLTFNAYQRENTQGQQYLFGGKEVQDEMGLGWMDHGARMYMPDLGRWSAIDPHTDKYEIISPYNYAFNNPSLFIDPTGKDNIIYLILAGGGPSDPKVNMEELAKEANEILKTLGLNEKIKVLIYNTQLKGKFDPKKLTASDSWAVVGSNRRQVASMARQIEAMDNRETKERNNEGQSVYTDFINSWEKKEYKDLNPEISDRGIDNTDGRGMGITVHTENIDPQSRRNKMFWAAFNLLHGAGHNSGSFHRLSGIMQEGNDVIYGPRLNDAEEKNLLNPEVNAPYIELMLKRFNSPKPIDNYGKKKQ